MLRIRERRGSTRHKLNSVTCQRPLSTWTPFRLPYWDTNLFVVGKWQVFRSLNTWVAWYSLRRNKAVSRKRRVEIAVQSEMICTMSRFAEGVVAKVWPLIERLDNFLAPLILPKLIIRRSEWVRSLSCAPRNLAPPIPTCAPRGSCRVTSMQYPPSRLSTNLRPC